MNPKLSIIIPCYNCFETLKEAVDSCYTQGFLDDEFEIVMVDDGSTDSTWALMQELAELHSNIKILKHGRNRGGGAARNTGILKSSGSLVYCLDSDNIFDSSSLQKMVNYLVAQNYDGVAFGERRFFQGKNTQKYTSHYNQITGKILLENLFDDTQTLLDNFLFTRKSYDLTEGYPENHGFDTQCFEMRYLAAGNHVAICPGSSFYHRQKGEQKSYFERVYESGEFSKNMYLIYEDIFFLFSESVQKFIMSFDIFTKNSLDANIQTSMRKKYLEAPDMFFKANHLDLLGPKAFEAYITNHDPSTIERAVWNHKQGKYEEALSLYQQEISKGKETPLTYFNILRAYTGLSPRVNTPEIENKVLSLLDEMNIPKRRMTWRDTITTKFLNLLS